MGRLLQGAAAVQIRHRPHDRMEDVSGSVAPSDTHLLKRNRALSGCVYGTCAKQIRSVAKCCDVRQQWRDCKRFREPLNLPVLLNFCKQKLGNHLKPALPYLLLIILPCCQVTINPPPEVKGPVIGSCFYMRIRQLCNMTGDIARPSKGGSSGPKPWASGMCKTL
jgi:hypothetical protein